MPLRLVQQFDGFDERFRRDEDIELAYRLADHGVEFVYRSDAIGWHYAERSYEGWCDIAFQYGYNDVVISRSADRNLLEMCAQGRFREDLYYRLGVINVTLPPLRKRKDEIPVLIEYFNDEAAEKLNRRPLVLSRRLRTFLLNYAYPGNIRELRNIIFRMSCLAGDTADFEHLPEMLRPARQDSRADAGEDSAGMSLGELKKAASDAADSAS